MNSETFATYHVPNFTAAVACILDLVSPDTGEDFNLEAGWTADSSPCWRYTSSAFGLADDIYIYTIIRGTDARFTVVCTINFVEV